MLDRLDNLRCFFCVWLIILLNPVLYFSKSALSFLVDNVTIGTYNFTSVILIVAFVGLLTAATAGFPPWAGTASLVALLVNTIFRPC